MKERPRVATRRHAWLAHAAALRLGVSTGQNPWDFRPRLMPTVALRLEKWLTTGSESSESHATPHARDRSPMLLRQRHGIGVPCYSDRGTGSESHATPTEARDRSPMLLAMHGIGVPCYSPHARDRSRFMSWMRINWISMVATSHVRAARPPNTIASIINAAPPH